MASFLWHNKKQLCSAFVTFVLTNEAGVLRAAPSLIIVAGAQVQYDKWSSGEGILSFPMFSLMIFQAQTRTASIHSVAKVPAHKSPCHFDVLLISEEKLSLTCMRIVKRIQTSAQRLCFSMLLLPAQSVSYRNDTFKGCRAQTFLSAWLIIAESCVCGGGGHNTVENVETKNI